MIVGGPKRHGSNYSKAGSLKRIHHRGGFKIRSAPGCGPVTLGFYSSLRKRMRAARRAWANGEKFTAWWPQNKKAELAMLRRHPWYRRKEAWDKLRKLTEQP